MWHEGVLSSWNGQQTLPSTSGSPISRGSGIQFEAAEGDSCTIGAGGGTSSDRAGVEIIGEFRPLSLSSWAIAAGEGAEIGCGGGISPAQLGPILNSASNGTLKP